MLLSLLCMFSQSHPIVGSISHAARHSPLIIKMNKTKQRRNEIKKNLRGRMCVHCRSIQWRCPHRKLSHLVRSQSQRSREFSLAPRTQCQAHEPSITIDNSRRDWRHGPTASRWSSQASAMSNMSQTIKPLESTKRRVSCVSHWPRVAPFSTCWLGWGYRWSINRWSKVEATKNFTRKFSLEVTVDDDV